MYIMINYIKGEKTIDLSYPIHSTAGRGKEIAVVSMHIINSQILLHRPIEVLSELNNSDNLEDGKPSKTLFTYFVTSPEYFTHFKHQSPQYKKLKNDTITSLTLAITGQNNDIITDGPEVTVVLHIQ